MVKLLIILTLAMLPLAAGGATTAHGQGAQPTPAATTDAGITANGVIGEVTAIDAAANRLTVKTDAGASLSVVLSEKTAYMRLAPGEKTLTNAVKIQLADVAEDQKSVPAIALIVMTKADLAAKHERERAEWRRRGIAGIITELNPNTKEITLSMRGRGEATPVLIPTTAGDVKFRRYAPDSVRFSDARPSSFAELKVGDQLRALGERSANGARFTPQEIVSGAFRTIGGAITSVNAEAGELKIKDVQGGQTVTVVVSRDSLLRRLPPEMAARLARRAAGRAGGSGEGDEAANAPGARRREPGARSSAQEGQGSRRPDGGTGEGRGQNGDGARVGRGGFDFQEMLERLPALPLAELKPGDMIIVSSTVGAEASRVTAIKLVAGVDELLNTAQRRQGRQGGGGAGGGAGDGGLGLDSGTIDFGIGLP
jgi:hypothetical protein